MTLCDGILRHLQGRGRGAAAAATADPAECAAAFRKGQPATPGKEPLVAHLLGRVHTDLHHEVEDVLLLRDLGGQSSL